MEDQVLTMEELIAKKQEQYAQLISQMKIKFGRVKMLMVGEGDEAKAVFFRLPLRPELSSCQKVAMNDDGTSDVYRKADQIITDCLLGGDLNIDQIIADVSIYTPIARFVLFDLVEEKKTQSVNC